MELEKLLLHPRTRQSVELFLKWPTHALLLTGESGSGKAALGKAIASKLLNTGAVSSHPFFITISKQEADREISIEQVRLMSRSLRLKTAGKENVRRVVMIENAEDMSSEAQNSLLKALEEPPPDTVFILTSRHEKLLLPTTVSRTQSITVDPVGKEAALQYFKDSPSDEVEKYWLLSQGNVGLLSALLDNDNNHPLKQAVETAKQLLKATPYERLIILEVLSGDRRQLDDALTGLSRVVVSLHHGSVQSGSAKKQAALLKTRQLIAAVQSDLRNNANTKLAVCHLTLNMAI